MNQYNQKELPLELFEVLMDYAQERVNSKWAKVPEANMKLSSSVALKEIGKRFARIEKTKYACIKGVADIEDFLWALRSWEEFCIEEIYKLSPFELQEEEQFEELQ